MSTTLAVRDLGRMPYREALALQERMVLERASGDIPDTLLLVEHEPVLTTGRGAAPGGILADAGTLAAHGLDVVPVARGGDVTWHGPGQLVGYPICHLDAQGRDLHRFLRRIEEALIDVLNRHGIEGHTREARTGVWVQDRKIASIGIAVRRWVTYHGFALNVSPDLSHFGLIHPCGLRGVQMTTMAMESAGAAPAWVDVRDAVIAATAARLGYANVHAAGASAAEPTGAAA